MKKVSGWLFLVCVAIVISLTGCKTEGEITTSPSEPFYSQFSDGIQGTLVVNGKVIDSEYTVIFPESPPAASNVYFSLTAVLKALGAEIHRMGGKFFVVYEDNIRVIDTKEELWGIMTPPGGYGVRIIEGNDLILDIFAVKNFLKYYMHADYVVNNKTATVTFFQVEEADAPIVPSDS